MFIEKFIEKSSHQTYIFHGTVYKTAFFFAWVILTRYLDEEAKMIGEKQQQSGSQEKDSKETGEWSFFYC